MAAQTPQLRQFEAGDVMGLVREAVAKRAGGSGIKALGRYEYH